MDYKCLDNFFLVGNPNAGKTTLFNKLTKSFEHTGNWHGVTVETKNKIVKYKNKNLNFIDLPGIYNLSSYSFEEEISVQEIYKNKNNIFLNVCDCNLIHKNLYLTLCLMEYGIKPILVLNFFENAKKNNINVDIKKLSNNLNLLVINSKNLDLEHCYKLLEGHDNSVFQEEKNNLIYLKNLPIEEIKNIINENFINLKEFNKEYICIKVLEDDENIIKKLKLDNCQILKINKIKEKENFKHLIAKLRYNYIKTILQDCVIRDNNFVYGRSKVDKVVLNKFLAIPIFLLIMIGIFYLTFSSVGLFISIFLKNLIDKIFLPVGLIMRKYNFPNWFIDLFNLGLINSVGGILSFIPQIVILFLFLSLLEDSGYMSRLAFCFEDVLQYFGLSGKSIYTIIMSFGCSTTAVLTSRTIEDKNTKTKTAIMCPYLSCSAKLPIYAVICGAFFSKNNFLIIVLLYILGVIIALIVALILNKTILTSGEKSFILEFPPYRKLSLNRTFNIIFENCKNFISKVGTIILSFSVIVFILQNFSFDFCYVPSSILNKKSMLQVICEFISPIFKPIGLNNWGIVACLLVGVLAKEMVVGTMAIINKVPNTSNFEKNLGVSLIASGFVISFSKITAIVFMVFSLLYFPCISTITVMKKEIGFKKTFIACFIQFLICYLLCFILYKFLVVTYIFKIIILFLVILLSVFLIKILNKANIKFENKCKNYCLKCEKYKC